MLEPRTTCSNKEHQYASGIVQDEQTQKQNCRKCDKPRPPTTSPCLKVDTSTDVRTEDACTKCSKVMGPESTCKDVSATCNKLPHKKVACDSRILFHCLPSLHVRYWIATKRV